MIAKNAKKNTRLLFYSLSVPAGILFLGSSSGMFGVQ
jgi:hypothetical protein